MADVSNPVPVTEHDNAKHLKHRLAIAVALDDVGLTPSKVVLPELRVAQPSRGSVVARGPSGDSTSADVTRLAWFSWLAEDRHRRLHEGARRLLTSTACHWILIACLTFVLFAADIAAAVSASSTADQYIDAVLLAAMGVFGLEAALTFFVQQQSSILTVFMDIILIVLIAADLSWLQQSWTRYDNGNHTLSRATVIASRTGKMTRLLHALQYVRSLKAWLATRALWQSYQRVKGDFDDSSIRVGMKLATQNIQQAALLILITVSIVPMMSYVIPFAAPATTVAVFEPLVGLPRSSVQPFVDAFSRQFQSGAKGRIFGEVPVVLQVGSEVWDLSSTFGGFTRRHLDREHFISASGTVILDMNVARRNHANAYLAICLALFLVVELFIFTAVLQRTAVQLLLSPVNRILNVLRSNAAEVLSTLEKDQEPGDSELDIMEAAVQRMTRVMAQMEISRNSSNAWQHLQGVETDSETKSWLSQLAGSSAHHAKAPPELHSYGSTDSRIASLAARMSMLRKHSSYTPPPPQRITGCRGSSEGLQDVLRDPAVATAMHIRNAVADADPEALDSWDLDVFFYTREQLIAHVCRMFMRLGLTQHQVALLQDVQSFGLQGPHTPATYLAALAATEQQESFHNEQSLVDLEVLYKFIEQVSMKYRNVPYHNFWHVCDVAHTTFRFVLVTRQSTLMTPYEMLAIMLAALCHDLDHPGVNNAFLIATQHPLARTYNDISVLENRHLATLFTLLHEQPEVNVLSGLDPAQWKHVRKMIIDAVLHTDMYYHFPMVSKVQLFKELHAARMSTGSNGADVEVGVGPLMGQNLFATPEDRLFMMSVLLHSADISNPTKPQAISDKWAQRILQEFFDQGDQERSLGLPISPMMDRMTASPAQIQTNFIEFIVAPLFSEVAAILPELEGRFAQLLRNRQTWNERCLTEIEKDAKRSPEEKVADQAKANARFWAFQSKYAAEFARESSSGGQPDSPEVVSSAPSLRLPLPLSSRPLGALQEEPSSWKSKLSGSFAKKDFLPRTTSTASSGAGSGNFGRLIMRLTHSRGSRPLDQIEALNSSPATSLPDGLTSRMSFDSARRESL